MSSMRVNCARIAASGGAAPTVLDEAWLPQARGERERCANAGNRCTRRLPHRGGLTSGGFGNASGGVGGCAGGSTDPASTTRRRQRPLRPLPRHRPPPGTRTAPPNPRTNTSQAAPQPPATPCLRREPRSCAGGPSAAMPPWPPSPARFRRCRAWRTTFLQLVQSTLKFNLLDKAIGLGDGRFCWQAA